MEKIDQEGEFGTVAHVQRQTGKIFNLSLDTNEVTLKAYLPILIPLTFEDFDKNVSEILTELVSLSGSIQFPLEEYGSHETTIELFENEKQDELLSKVWVKPTHIRDLKILKFAIDKPILVPEKTYFVEDNKKIFVEGSAARSIHLLFIIETFEKRIYDFLITTHIACPGYLDVDEGYLFFNDKYYDRIQGMKSSIREAYQLSNELGWPKLDKLNIIDVWDWTKEIDEFISGIGKTPLGRALCALSYLFKPGIMHEGALDLVWTLVGLEALYCKDITGIQKQLTEKSQVLLGEVKENKRKFKKMYDIRSRLIHGSVDFPSKYCFKHAEPAFEKFTSDNYQATLVAEALLIATLQEMYKNKYSKLEFVYKIEDC